MAGSVGSEEGDFGFQIAPMVDVVFVLMLFFMASAGSQVVEKELNLNLPSGQGTSSSTTVTPIIIDIGPDGTVSMNDETYGLPCDRIPGLSFGMYSGYSEPELSSGLYWCRSNLTQRAKTKHLATYPELTSISQCLDGTSPGIRARSHSGPAPTRSSRCFRNVTKNETLSHKRSKSTSIRRACSGDGFPYRGNSGLKHS